MNPVDLKKLILSCCHTEDLPVFFRDMSPAAILERLTLVFLEQSPYAQYTDSYVVALTDIAALYDSMREGAIKK